VNAHVTRTGDYDAVLIFFITVMRFPFFFILNIKTPNTCIFFSRAYACDPDQSVQGMIILPALLIYLISAKKISALKTNVVY